MIDSFDHGTNSALIIWNDVNPSGNFVYYKIGLLVFHILSAELAP